jgi:predicted site-specific integrase-resolvase
MQKVSDPDKSSHVPVRHLSQKELAQRWSMSHRSLERWRWEGKGPRFLKIGGRAIYRLEDVEAYEAEQLRTSTADSPNSAV